MSGGGVSFAKSQTIFALRAPAVVVRAVSVLIEIQSTEEMSMPNCLEKGKDLEIF